MAQTQQDQHQDLEVSASTKDSSLAMNTPQAENDAQVTKEKHSQSPVAALKRYPFIVLLTICYITVTAGAWGLMCVIIQRPINGSTYGLELNSTNYLYGSKPQFGHHPYQNLFITNERYLKTVRILQSGVSVLTIPLTSAVCSRAAVVFAQRRLSQGTGRGRITLRQTMALADKGWTDPSIIAKLLFGKWRQYGSQFLLLALTLNTIGALISPLQEIFVSYKSVKTQTYLQRVMNLIDFVNHSNGNWPGDLDGGTIPSLVRSRLASAQGKDVQMRLWSGSDAFGNNATSTATAVASGQFTLANMSSLHEPFWSQLPAGFSTGLITQYAPRINSTATWELISPGDFPSTCSQDPEALYLQYSNYTDNYTDIRGYTVEICMPANMTKMPWKPQKSRQDFTEELYLKMNFTERQWLGNPDDEPGVHTVRITMATTAGYFELPNYRNNLTAGELLNDGPEQVVDSKYYVEQSFPDGAQDSTSRADFNQHENDHKAPKGSAANATGSFLSNFNKGPLNTIVLALFGQASFLDITHTALGTYSRDSWNQSDREYGCIMTVPLMDLLQSGYADLVPPSRPCVSRNQGELVDMVRNYLYLFVKRSANFPDGEVIENAFTAAAFIANEAWFLNNYDGILSLTVSYDFGADTDVPHMSRAGLILISFLLVLDLTCLLGLSLYSVAWTPRWTEQFDAFAMMRIGAAVANDAPLWVAGNVDRIKFLDETPGWVGESIDEGHSENGTKDGLRGVAAVGILRLGAKGAIRRKRKYRAYETAQKRREGQKQRLK